MRCDLDCPFGMPYCCRACANGRKNIKDKYPDKWTDRFGYWSPDGCKLGEDRPQECKEYDCKKFAFYSVKTFVGGRWRTTALHEVLLEKKDKEFIDKYNNVFKDVI